MSAEIDGITLITCTGMRPEGISRCSQYVFRFQYPDDLPIQWLVVDDGMLPSRLPISNDRISVEIIRPQHRWNPDLHNTLALNLLAAIPHVRYSTVMFIEDDDWYAPEYVCKQMERLRTGASIVGETPARYYHVATARYCEMPPHIHASLCQTAVRVSELQVLQTICEAVNTDFIDVRLWNYTAMRKHLLSRSHFCVGIKGLPGRPGIGAGHDPGSNMGWIWDPSRDKLRSWIGDDVALYGQKTTAAR